MPNMPYKAWSIKIIHLNSNPDKNHKGTIDNSLGGVRDNSQPRARAILVHDKTHVTTEYLFPIFDVFFC